MNQSVVSTSLAILSLLWACGKQEEAVGPVNDATGDRPAASPNEPDASPVEHAKVEVIYDQGAFRLGRRFAANGQVRSLRSVRSSSGLRFVARQGERTLFTGSMPDLRARHFETADPKTGEFQRHPNLEQRPVTFLLDIPSGTERIDFYEARDPESKSPIGSIDLRRAVETKP